MHWLLEYMYTEKGAGGITYSTVEHRYNEVLGTMKITLLYQVSHIRVQKQRNIKSWDQQNYLVIRGFCYIRPRYNEVPLYVFWGYQWVPYKHTLQVGFLKCNIRKSLLGSWSYLVERSTKHEMCITWPDLGENLPKSQRLFTFGQNSFFFPPITPGISNGKLTLTQRIKKLILCQIFWQSYIGWKVFCQWTLTKMSLSPS